MSKDKYSSDHTIQVGGGNGTLTIDANVQFSGGIVDYVVLSSPVRQTIRFPGIAFRPENSSDFSNVTYNSDNGRVSFGATQADVVVAVNIPHGAEWQDIRAVGNAEGVSDSITITLREVDGNTSGSIIPAPFSWSNEGSTEQDDTVPAATQGTVMDYTDNKAYFIRVRGQAAPGGDAYIAYIDITYSIQRFPQSTLSSPV